MLLLVAGTGAVPAPSSRAEQRAELEPATPAGDGGYKRLRSRTAHAHAVSRPPRDDDQVAPLKRVLHEIDELAHDVERSVARKRPRLDVGARLLERVPPVGTVSFPMVGTRRGGVYDHVWSCFCYDIIHAYIESYGPHRHRARVRHVSGRHGA